MTRRRLIIQTINVRRENVKKFSLIDLWGETKIIWIQYESNLK